MGEGKFIDLEQGDEVDFSQENGNWVLRFGGQYRFEKLQE
jgi:hypothetical protein